MLITADQLVAHAVGDYILQTDHMANRKVKSWPVALWHAYTYSLPFLFLTRSLPALAVILGTHALIDRYKLARYVVFAKNQLAPRAWRTAWADCSATGYPNDRPAWLAVWLLIIADNVLHVLINGLALKYLGGGS